MVAVRMLQVLLIERVDIHVRDLENWDSLLIPIFSLTNRMTPP